MSMSPRYLATFATLIVTILLPGLSAVGGDRAPADPAVSAVREALQREIYGLDADRQELLAAAAQQAPQHAPAWWHQGYVQDGKQGWIRHADFLDAANRSDRLAAYERERERCSDTIDGQLELAEWCAKHRLPGQQRAHLTRVIDLAPEHPVARAQLGFVQQGGLWISSEEIARQQAQAASRRAALRQWLPKLREVRAGLEHRSPQRRSHALARLNETRDPAAVPAIEDVFGGAAGEVQIAGVGALANISDPAASLALAQVAALGSSQDVRNSAVDALSKRDLDSFVPQLLASLSSPIVSRFLATTLPTGRIGYRHVFAREGQEQVNVMTLDTEFRRIPLIGGNRRETTGRAFDQAADTARQRQEQLAVQNRQIAAMNERLMWVLQNSTGENLPAAPEAWWQWWNDRNEVFIADVKPQSFTYQADRVAVADSVPDLSSSNLTAAVSPPPAPRRSDCLAAGTPVWTIKGPQAIETIRVGDLVLAQHADTGELRFQPVLRTTLRPRGGLIRIEAGGEIFQTSGGHLFWVAGEGWVKSRDLVSGQILHSVHGPVHITHVASGIEAETYNLIVADFATYFVGQQQVLSHDNSVSAPTRALVPGLLAE